MLLGQLALCLASEDSSSEQGDSLEAGAAVSDGDLNVPVLRDEFSRILRTPGGFSRISRAGSTGFSRILRGGHIGGPAGFSRILRGGGPAGFTRILRAPAGFSRILRAPAGFSRILRTPISFSRILRDYQDKRDSSFSRILRSGGAKDYDDEGLVDDGSDDLEEIELMRRAPGYSRISRGQHFSRILRR